MDVARRILRTLFFALALAGLLWVSFRAQVNGRTPYEHFREAGGERAVHEGLSWIGTRVEAGAASAWASARGALTYAKGRAVEWGESAWTAAVATWRAWWREDGGPKPSSEGSSAASARRPAGGASSARVGTGGQPEESPAPEPSPKARARAVIERLEEVVERSDAPVPGQKVRTTVDHRIAPEQKAALDAKLAARRDEE